MTLVARIRQIKNIFSRKLDPVIWSSPFWPSCRSCCWTWWWRRTCRRCRRTDAEAGFLGRGDAATLCTSPAERIFFHYLKKKKLLRGEIPLELRKFKGLNSEVGARVLKLSFQAKTLLSILNWKVLQYRASLCTIWQRAPFLNGYSLTEKMKPIFKQNNRVSLFG